MRSLMRFARMQAEFEEDIVQWGAEESRAGTSESWPLAMWPW